jgi:hypothetical protein
MHVSPLLAETACILQVKHVVISEGTRSARPSLSLIKIAQRERRSTANGMPSCRTVALDVLDARFVFTLRSTTPFRSDFVRLGVAIRPIPFALDSPGHTLNRPRYDDSADQNETEMKSFNAAISAPPSAAEGAARRPPGAHKKAAPIRADLGQIRRSEAIRGPTQIAARAGALL